MLNERSTSYHKSINFLRNNIQNPSQTNFSVVNLRHINPKHKKLKLDIKKDVVKIELNKTIFLLVNGIFLKKVKKIQTYVYLAINIIINITDIRPPLAYE